MKKIYIFNKSGEKEVFSPRKIYEGIKRAGAPKSLARNITEQIKKKAFEGITTREIFDEAKRILFQEKPVAGMKFSLKEAIRKLGPSGFPFEKYIGDIFESLGFFVQLNQHIGGRCVFHEIDFLALKQRQLLIGECKYHYLAGSRVELKVALAVYARFLDIKNGSFLRKKSLKNFRPRPMLVTNTKFTSETIKYAGCIKVDLLGWRYPLDHGLEYLIESEKLYPVTVLPSCDSRFLNILSQEGLMLAKEILSLDHLKLSKTFDLEKESVLQLKKEAQALLSS